LAVIKDYGGKVTNEIDEMTAREVSIDTCLEILRAAKMYGMHRAKQDARTIALQQFEEVCFQYTPIKTNKNLYRKISLHTVHC
jgi:hypothetical protein